jgi:hypothetical protein
MTGRIHLSLRSDLSLAVLRPAQSAMLTGDRGGSIGAPSGGTEKARWAGTELAGQDEFCRRAAISRLASYFGDISCRTPPADIRERPFPRSPARVDEPRSRIVGFQPKTTKRLSVGENRVLNRDECNRMIRQ